MAWISGLSLSFKALLKYESAPGLAGVAPVAWPSDSKVHLSATGDTLIMLAHPLCPCSRASMSELAEVMASARGKVHAYVLFLKPADQGTGWDDTELRRSAAQIPGVTVLSDSNGDEARRFGAETSGHTLLFDKAGRLVFSGGITQSRGHAGDNAGENAIISLINTRAADRAKTPVFGCSLMEKKTRGQSVASK